MNNKYLLLRHALTRKDPNLPSTEWNLEPDAMQTMERYLKEKIFHNVTKIFSSPEPKAISSALPISKVLRLEIEILDNFKEVQRENKFLTEDEFRDQKIKELTYLDNVENGKESGQTALNRFIEGINKLEAKYKNENILISSHGTILALYISHIMNKMKPEEIIFVWDNIPFLGLAILEQGKLTKNFN